MKLLVLLLSALSCCAGVSPNTLHIQSSIPYRFSPVAYYSPNSPQNTLNGEGMSQLKNLAPDTRENWLLWSEDFTQAVWTKAQLNAFGVDDSGTAGAGSFANTSRTTDPLGGNTADFIQEDATAGSTHEILHSTGGTVLSDGTYSQSLYVKAAGRSQIYCVIYAALGFHYRVFDVGTGTLGSQLVAGDAIDSGSTITSVGNGWYLCTMSTTLVGRSYVCYWDVSNGGLNVYDGDNTSGLFLWGAQLRRTTKSPAYVKTEAIRYVAEDRDLNQSTAASQPLLSNMPNGMLCLEFDGTDDYMKTATFPFVQPETVMGVFEQVSGFVGSALVDGFVDGSAQIYQISPPNLALYAGFAVASNNDLPIGTPGTITAVFNGVSSQLTINGGTATTGNPGATAANGFRIGYDASIASANIRTGDIFLFDRVLTSAEQSCLVQWLGRRYGVSVW